jgi:SAM-dependent methyltransferase
MSDILGKALQDYQNGNYTEDITTETNISEEDALPLPYLFRDFDNMPALEQTALKYCEGSVFDVGCGAGSQALYLQQKGHQVTAIDISEGAITVAKQRGVNNARKTSVLDFKNETFHTILILMNGTGIFQKMEFVAIYLQHLKTLLKKDGQILIDSSDLKYMYGTFETEEGEGIIVPPERYYGELEFTMAYKNEKSAPFPWLYLDKERFALMAQNNGFKFKILYEGENFDYLAQLTILENIPLQ